MTDDRGSMAVDCATGKGARLIEICMSQEKSGKHGKHGSKSIKFRRVTQTFNIQNLHLATSFIS